MNLKPKINALITISQGEIIKIDMNEGTGPEDRQEITNEIVKMINLRNIVEAEMINFEKREQKKFMDLPAIPRPRADEPV